MPVHKPNMKIPILRTLCLIILLSTLIPQPSTVFAQTTAFTYQGRLNDNGAPASGNYDLQFKIYDSAGGPGLVGGPVTTAPVAVANGLFTVALDFGPGVFTGADRWLEIGVRPNGDTGAYTVLSPRQPITATPYAITASRVTGAIPLAQLPAAVLTNNQSGVTFNGALTLNGNLNLPATTGGAGVIYSDGAPLLHTYGNANFFAGAYAGNLTMSGAGNNTGVGYAALNHNTSGKNNTANGLEALYSNNTGNDNTANGFQALFSNTDGVNNTANGSGALYSNTSGNHNSAVGLGALYFNTTGDNNIALGDNAGAAVTTGSSNIEIGNPGAGGDNATIRLGTPGTHANTFIAGIYDAAAGGKVVYVAASGQLGTGGTIPDAQLSANIARLDGTNVFTGTNTFNGAVVMTNIANRFVIENRTDDPSPAVPGQIWLRTDL
jgi:hypothetical protein